MLLLMALLALERPRAAGTTAPAAPGPRPATAAREAAHTRRASIPLPVGAADCGSSALPGPALRDSPGSGWGAASGTIEAKRVRRRVLEAPDWQGASASLETSAAVTEQPPAIAGPIRHAEADRTIQVAEPSSGANPIASSGSSGSGSELALNRRALQPVYDQDEGLDPRKAAELQLIGGSSAAAGGLPAGLLVGPVTQAGDGSLEGLLPAIVPGAQAQGGSGAAAPHMDGPLAAAPSLTGATAATAIGQQLSTVDGAPPQAMLGVPGGPAAPGDARRQAQPGPAPVGAPAAATPAGGGHKQEPRPAGLEQQLQRDEGSNLPAVVVGDTAVAMAEQHAAASDQLRPPGAAAAAGAAAAPAWPVAVGAVAGVLIVLSAGAAALLVRRARLLREQAVYDAALSGTPAPARGRHRLNVGGLGPTGAAMAPRISVAEGGGSGGADGTADSGSGISSGVSSGRGSGRSSGSGSGSGSDPGNGTSRELGSAR
jgi:hypothetical protein